MVFRWLLEIVREFTLEKDDKSTAQTKDDIKRKKRYYWEFSLPIVFAL